MPIQIIECPRDAMQSWKKFIPTNQKIEYLNALLQVGFHTLDCGSFVSPKTIPQMADTKDVLQGLQMQNSKTKLLTIVANERGANDAMQFEKINYLGFPFSISPTFQLRNTNSTMQESIKTIAAIQKLCLKNKKEVIVYLSMAFGNPYGDTYNIEIVNEYTNLFANMGINIISLADTVGVATEDEVSKLCNAIIPSYANSQIGVHLHSSTNNAKAKLEAALKAGCKRIDGALKGIGGCPMAGNALVGNMDTIVILKYLEKENLNYTYNTTALNTALQLANIIFKQ